MSALKIRRTDDKDALARFFRADPALYAYCLGDLDPLFFPNTTWWVAEGDGIEASFLLYKAFDIAVIMALADNEAQGRLWDELLPTLPGRALVHFRSRHAGSIERRYRLKRLGPHHRMLWKRSDRLPKKRDPRIRALAREDLPGIRDFYALAYPTAHFEPRMLDIGKILGWFEDGQLASIATCHVHSLKYSVATLGGIATHPDFRGRGFGTAVTKALLRDVAAHIADIGLNVHAGNVAAIRIYEGLGFRRRHDYEEAVIEAR